MQTFLPYANFQESAKVLDRLRLNKQRIETYQILLALINKDYGWQNHPAVKMWRNYEWQLYIYGLNIIQEWRNRGFKDSIANKLTNLATKYDWTNIIPKWLGEEKFHAAMRSNLLRKDPVWYGRFGWAEPNNLPYVWPVI